MADVEIPNPEELREQSEDRFGRRVGLTVALYAVALAVTSLGGGNAAKETMLAQQQASNLWAYYQAKAIRESEYNIQRQILECDLEDGRVKSGDATRKLIEDFKKKVATYAKEKEEIQADARRQEAIRDLNTRKDPYFDYAEVLLQIAIVTASVSMLSRNRPVFVVSLFLAAAGVLLCINGYGLFVNIPFIGD